VWLGEEESKEEKSVERITEKKNKIFYKKCTIGMLAAVFFTHFYSVLESVASTLQVCNIICGTF